MGHVKKQHSVSRFLLKNFVNHRGLVWYYDKYLKKVKEEGIGGVAYADFFYDRQYGQKEGSFEYFFNRAETDAAPLLREIVETKSLENITKEERVIVSMFTALQLLRTQTALSEINYFNSQFYDFASSMTVEANTDIGTIKTLGREMWFSLFTEVHLFGAILANKSWMLFESDEKFYCSDHPLVRQNISQKERAKYRGVLGLNSDGIEIYFPLSPSLILGMCCERTYSQLENKNYPCSSGGIENFNSLQVQYSDRFIFSKTNDFTLVEDMYIKGQVQ